MRSACAITVHVYTSVNDDPEIVWVFRSPIGIPRAHSTSPVFSEEHHATIRIDVGFGQFSFLAGRQPARVPSAHTLECPLPYLHCVGSRADSRPASRGIGAVRLALIAALIEYLSFLTSTPIGAEPFIFERSQHLSAVHVLDNGKPSRLFLIKPGIKKTRLARNVPIFSDGSLLHRDFHAVQVMHSGRAGHLHSSYRTQFQCV